MPKFQPVQKLGINNFLARSKFYLAVFCSLGSIVWLSSLPYPNKQNTDYYSIVSYYLKHASVLTNLIGLVYNVNNWADKEEDLINDPEKHRFYQQYGSYIITMYSLGLIWGLIAINNMWYIITTLLILMISLWYSISIKWSSRIYSRRLKDRFIIKNLTVGAMHSLGSFVLPVLYSENFLSDNILIISSTMVLVTINSIIFDYRDIKGDKEAGIHTLAIYWGQKTPRYLMVISLSWILLPWITRCVGGTELLISSVGHLLYMVLLFLYPLDKWNDKYNVIYELDAILIPSVIILTKYWG